MGKDVPKFLIYLPEGESQELSLLFMHYLLKSRRFRVIHIGSNINVSDIQDAFNIHQPHFVYTIISETFVKPPIKEYIYTLTTAFPNTQFLLSGYQVITQNVQNEKHVTVLKTLDQTIDYINRVQTSFN